MMAAAEQRVENEVEGNVSIATLLEDRREDEGRKKDVKPEDNSES